MPVTGIHTLVYSSEPEALRAVLGRIFGWKAVDAGGGWLIFALPPAEIGVHPAEKDSPSQGRHELALMCDDLPATMRQLRAAGLSFRGEPRQEPYGVVVEMELPGGVAMTLYEPRHASPLSEETARRS